jgi:hypothetical protein
MRPAVALPGTPPDRETGVREDAADTDTPLVTFVADGRIGQGGAEAVETDHGERVAVGIRVVAHLDPAVTDERQQRGGLPTHPAKSLGGP